MLRHIPSILINAEPVMAHGVWDVLVEGACDDAIHELGRQVSSHTLSTVAHRGSLIHTRPTPISPTRKPLPILSHKPLLPFSLSRCMITPRTCPPCSTFRHEMSHFRREISHVSVRPRRVSPGAYLQIRAE